MISRTITVYLMAFPIGLMGAIQLCFGLLSVIVFSDGVSITFFVPAISMLMAASLCLVLSKEHDISKIRYKDALSFAVFTWIVCGALASIPIILITEVSLTDGIFESISALTTTGATILTGLDLMPQSFLLYRQFLQWLGGLGVVIFVVSILPMLNVGGMKLLKAETPGPIKDNKLSPRVAKTAHYLWFVYLLLTVLCAIGYYIGGMSAYDAIAHSLTTVSTGGFSTHDMSMGYFHNPVLLVISDVFMLLGAISFALHFRVMQTKKLVAYWHDEETRVFLYTAFTLSISICALLLFHHQYEHPLSALNQATFHLISFITSTGYGATSFTEWPVVVLLLLIFAGFLGGCAGSTAGGNKIIRNILSIKIIILEIKRLLHPHAVFTVKYQGATVGIEVLRATTAFMLIAAISTMILTLCLMITGLDFWSALTATAACLNVLGPAFGKLGSNFQPVSDTGTWILSFAMILGRLEYFTVLALFLPRFWRH